MATTGSGTSTSEVFQSGSLTLAQLIDRWRKKLDDTVEPYMWGNDELTSYADYIQKEICHDVVPIEDRVTSGIAVITLAQGDGLIDIDPKVMYVSRAYVDGQTTLLDIKSAEYMDALYGVGWDSASVAQSVPTKLITMGVGHGKAYLYPPLLAASGTLKLTVYRGPLVDLDYDVHAASTLEVDRFSHLMVNGIMWQAYLKQDSETYDPRKAEQHRVLWEGINGHGGDKEKIRRLALRFSSAPECNSPMAAFQ